MIEIATNHIDRITPSVTDTVSGETLMRNYLWQVDNQRNIFLHMQMSLIVIGNESVLQVTTNLDSSSVKGQGKHLWSFLRRELQKIANGDLGDIGKIKVMHKVSPNEYSKHLLDDSYVKKGKDFYSIYCPN